MTTNAISKTMPSTSVASTKGSPAGRVTAVWLDAAGDRDEDRGQAHGERDVAPPVDAAAVPFAGVAQAPVCPDGAEDSDGHVHPEHRPPVPCGQQSPGHQADELSRQRSHLVEAEREATPVRRERIGENRRRVRGQHRSADGLQQPRADEPLSGRRTAEGVERQQNRRDGEDGESEVVDADAAVHVADAAERDHQHRLHQPVAHDHPQQVGDAGGRERIQMNAAEDRGQRDDDDRSVERGYGRPAAVVLVMQPSGSCRGPPPRAGR